MRASIELKDKIYQIKVEGSFPNLVRLQLRSFGFKVSDNNERIFNNKSEKFKIIEVIKYLKKNTFKVEVCSKTEEILKKISKNKIDFNNKIKLLRSIKKKFNSKEFDNFCNSLRIVKRNLKDHQKKACYHLYNSKSAANFSVPGSGKTSVVLAYYEKLLKEDKVKAIFVIGPKNCFYSWKTEFSLTLNRDSKIKMLDVNFKERKTIYQNYLNSELYTCHFMTLKNDIEYLINFFKKNNFLLVIDEAHNIKKIGGIWSTAVLELSSLCKHKVILTGTPMPNDYKDFYNYLDFLYGYNEIITPYEKAQIEVFIENNENDKAEILLSDKIYPFYTRVTKKELNLSKPNLHKPILIKMNPIEKEIHYAIISKIKYYSKKDYQKNIDLIRKIHKARVVRLRQVCSYVKNLITAIPEEETIRGEENLLADTNLQNLIATYDQKEKPAKLIKLKSMVKDLVNKNKKVLIWSTHLKTIDLIKKELSSEKINIKSITGAKKSYEREEIKNEFNDPKSNLDSIIAIPQACSESISLHKACQNAIYYDLNYNTAEFLQSLDRIHRVGGSEDKPVHYEFLQYKNSIDIKIYERVFLKADRQMRVIESDNLTFTPPDEEDYEELYSELNI